MMWIGIVEGAGAYEEDWNGFYHGYALSVCAPDQNYDGSRTLNRKTQVAMANVMLYNLL